MLCYVLLCYVIVMLCYVTFVMLRYVMLYYVVLLRFVMFCYCYVMLCFVVMLCYVWKIGRSRWSWWCKNSGPLSGLQTHATPSEITKGINLLMFFRPASLTKSRSKFLAPKLHLNHRPYSQNRIHKLISRVLAAACLRFENHFATNITTAIRLNLANTWLVAHKKYAYKHTGIKLLFCW